MINGELVGGEGTGLFQTHDGNGSQLFNGGVTGDDGLVLGELLGTDGEGDGQGGRHGNSDATDQEDEYVVETIMVGVVVGGVEDEERVVSSWSTREAAGPKVLAPVEMMTPSASPCLQVEPLRNKGDERRQEDEKRQRRLRGADC